jgi:hypothetical protein
LNQVSCSSMMKVGLISCINYKTTVKNEKLMVLLGLYHVTRQKRS